MTDGEDAAAWGIWLTWDSVSLAVGLLAWLYPKFEYPRWLSFTSLFFFTTHLTTVAVCAQALDVSSLTNVIAYGISMGVLISLVLWSPLVCCCGDWPLIGTVVALIVWPVAPLLIILTMTEFVRGEGTDLQTFAYLDETLPLWYLIWIAMLPIRVVPLWMKRTLSSCK
jgi:hypothetical protein